MKVINKGHKKWLQAENLFEMAALAWVHTHPATKYQPGVSRAQAFVAGIEWAQTHQEENIMPRKMKCIDYDEFTATMDYQAGTLTIQHNEDVIVFSKNKGIPDLADCLRSFGRPAMEVPNKEAPKKPTHWT